MKQIVFYQPGEIEIIDTVSQITGRGDICKETVEEVRNRYPEAILCPFDFAIDCINEFAKEKFCLLKPTKITEEDWFEALECLPPMQWRRSEGAESFKISEMTFGDITAGYVRICEEYYSINVRTKTTHDEMVNACMALDAHNINDGI